MNKSETLLRFINILLTFNKLKSFFRILRHLTHKAKVTSVNAEANVHSADLLMSVFVNELGSQGPAPCADCRRITKGTLDGIGQQSGNAPHAICCQVISYANLLLSVCKSGISIT